MSRSYLPVMLVATIFWLLVARFWGEAISGAIWSAGCAWTAWLFPASDSPTQNEREDA